MRIPMIPAQLLRLKSLHYRLLIGAAFLISASLPQPQAACAQLVSPNVRVSLPTLHREHEPQVAIWGEKLIVVWSRDSGHGVSWASSIDNGVSWIEGTALPSPNLAIAIPTITVDSSGIFTLATTFGSCGGLSVGIWRGAFAGDIFGWSGPLIALPCIPAFDVTLPWDSPHLTCDPVTGTLYLSCTRVRQTSDSTFEHEVQFTRSLDGGQTWDPPMPLSNLASTGSQPAVGPDGELYVVWSDYLAGQIVMRRSDDSGLSFGPEVTIAPTKSYVGSGPPAYRAPRGRRPPFPGACNFFPVSDFPTIAVDGSQGPRRGTVYVAWPEHGAGLVNPSTDTIYDFEPNNHFLTAQPILPGQDAFGEVTSGDLLPSGISDTDRYYFEGMAGMTIVIEGRMFSTDPPNDSSEPRCGGFSLFWAADTLQQFRFATMAMDESFVVESNPPIVCTLPTDGRYYIETTAGDYGVEYLLRFRILDIDVDEASKDQRDIILASSSDGGATWGPKVRVNDDLPYFDNSFPEIAVDDQGRVHAAWYDRRDNPANSRLAHTYWSMSLDGGQTFLPGVRVSEQASNWELIPSLGFHGSNVGDHLALGIGQDRAFIFWTQQGRPDIDIYGAAVTPAPVDLAGTAFTAFTSPAGITLRWVLTDPLGLVAHRVFRAENGQTADDERIELPVPSVIAGQTVYELTDEGAEPGRTYQYALDLVDRQGVVIQVGVRSVTRPWTTGHLAITASPNPFRTGTAFTIKTASTAPVVVDIHDVTGRIVQSFSATESSESTRVVSWNGLGNDGRHVTAGIYFARAHQGGASKVERLTITR